MMTYTILQKSMSTNLALFCSDLFIIRCLLTFHSFLKMFFKPDDPNHPLAARFDKANINGIKNQINKTLATWGNNEREIELRKAIDTISNPHLIQKVVCFGMGAIRTEPPKLLLPGWEQDNQRVVNQHAAAVMIVHQLQAKTGQEIKLFVGDPGYGEPHEEAFQAWSWPSEPSGIKFNLVDAAYNKHEHFTMVDDNTLVLEIGATSALVQLICSEYARPVAIIGQAIREGSEGKTINKHEDTFWYEVEFENRKYAIPGPSR